MRALPVLLLTVFLLSACSAPPQKEIDLAQGAIDAARAAGAEQFAPKEVAAASTALQQAHEAVGQRDYRLALTRALDAHDRALEAAKAAADGQVRARGELDAAIVTARAAIQRLEVRVAAAETERLPKADVDRARRAIADAEAELQKAGTAVSAADYAAAGTAIDGIPARISQQIEALDAAATKKPARPSRRGR